MGGRSFNITRGAFGGTHVHSLENLYSVYSKKYFIVCPVLSTLLCAPYRVLYIALCSVFCGVHSVNRGVLSLLCFSSMLLG